MERLTHTTKSLHAFPSIVIERSNVQFKIQACSHVVRCAKNLKFPQNAAQCSPMGANVDIEVAKRNRAKPQIFARMQAKTARSTSADV